MVRTPWGDSDTLRRHKLAPGTGVPPERVRESQRRRLFAAMVATVAAQGYEGTRVEDLVALSGVSRKAFYELFDDKRDCFLATIEAMVAPTIATVELGSGETAPGIERAREAFDAFVELIVAQPAAARLCFVEIYAAGPQAMEVIERTADAFEALVTQTLDRMPGREGMPPQIVRAMIGGLQKVIHRRLYRGEEGELAALVPQMWRWGLSYLPPPEDLRRPRRRARVPVPPSDGLDTAERLLRAVAASAAAKGYPETTVADIAERASTSLSTFYEHFECKEEAMLAALDLGSAQMLAAVLPAFRRAPDWPSSVRAAFESMFSFAAANPDFTRLGAVEVYAAGKRALEQRDEVMQGLEALLAPGYELAPETAPVAAEAIGGAIYALIYDQVKAAGPQSLPEMAPLATYVALAPFLGAEEACTVANGGTRRR